MGRSDRSAGQLILEKFNKLSRRRRYFLLTSCILLIIFAFLPGVPDFEDPLSAVLYDRNGQLMSARVSGDQQWRFPPSDSISGKFEKCILQFEDQYFYYHPGVNPVAVVRAAWQNINAGKVRSGASTISMQVIRLSRKNTARSVFEKFIETILAMRMECSLSKKEILALHASYAPFGGNVVGLEAASWRYFGRSSVTLSWGEAAALAVLPNAPSMVFPGRSEKIFLDKRNRLLDKLYHGGTIDSLTCELAKLEELPSTPMTLPDLAPHLLQTLAKKDEKGKIYHSSLDADLQTRFTNLLNRYHDIYSQNEVHNGAIIIIENRTRKVRAYVGNTDCNRATAGGKVDIITSDRSTGSLLKPFLYAAAMDEGHITSRSLVADIPIQISGFAPKNFNKKFLGASPAGDALTRSLNVPAVILLRQYGLEKFHHLLGKLNLQAIDKGPDHYGLSLILGGAESNLLELSAAYSGLMNTVLDFRPLEGNYYSGQFGRPVLLENETFQPGDKTSGYIISAGAASNVLQVLTGLERPRLEGDWKMFDNARKIAWKTGTSYGFRDAWSIGTSPEYTVGVWIGNASGEGRPFLIGLEMAAPVMFDVFNRLPQDSWFTPPYDDLAEVVICPLSGDLKGPHCESELVIDHPMNGTSLLRECKYHRLVHLNAAGDHQVNDRCYDVNDMKHLPWFVLPPAMEWYYIRQAPAYKRLPPFLPGCIEESNPVIQIIYPVDGALVRVPVQLNGEPGRIIFEAAHQFANANIHWHIDDNYQVTTNGEHKMEFLPSPGNHLLTLVDDKGHHVSIRFKVIE